MTISNLINQLESITNPSSIKENESSELDKNKSMCRMIRLHLKEFFDDIYIPYDYFADDDWNINKTLYDNDDALFYNKKYLTLEDENRFYQVFDKYIIMIEEIMSPTNHLSSFLKKWTDTSKAKWKSVPKKSYLKALLTDPKYQYISPNYTVNLFYDISKEFCGQTDKIRKLMEKKMNQLTKKVKVELCLFREIFMEIVRSYVFECPLDKNEVEPYTLGFINSLIMAIINLSEKLIELNVYAIHPLVNNIIESHIPLDEINKKPEKHCKKIYVV